MPPVVSSQPAKRNPDGKKGDFVPTCNICGEKHWPFHPLVPCTNVNKARTKAKAKAKADKKARVKKDRKIKDEVRKRLKDEQLPRLCHPKSICFSNPILNANKHNICIVYWSKGQYV